MSKPKPNDPLAQVNTKIPSSLVRKVRILLLDPTTGKVKYGTMSALVTSLLTGWVEDKQKKYAKGKPTNG